MNYALLYNLRLYSLSIAVFFMPYLAAESPTCYIYVQDDGQLHLLITTTDYDTYNGFIRSMGNTITGTNNVFFTLVIHHGGRRLDHIHGDARLIECL